MLLLWSFRRVRTCLPELKVERSCFQHVLHLLNWKSFGFWHENNDKENGCNSDEDEDHECRRGPNGLCQGQKGLSHNQIRNPIGGRCYSSTDSSVS